MYSQQDSWHWNAYHVTTHMTPKVSNKFKNDLTEITKTFT